MKTIGLLFQVSLFEFWYTEFVFLSDILTCKTNQKGFSSSGSASVVTSWPDYTQTLITK